MTPPIVVYGPQGCGKTANAERLRQAFGCDVVIDDWHPGRPKVPGALHLTNVDVRGAIPFAEAMKK